MRLSAFTLTAAGTLALGCLRLARKAPSKAPRPASFQRRTYAAALLRCARPMAQHRFSRLLLTQSRSPAWMKPAPAGTRRHSGIAVAQFGGSSVLWFKANDKTNKPPTVCEPADSTNGIRIDRKGNLWVPDGRANSTTEYAPNCGAAKLTIPDPTGEPADVAFDRHGHVYILNINDISGPPTVNVYTSKGKLLRTLSDPSFSVLFGVQSDNKGDVFVSNLTSSNQGIVIEFPQGKMPGTRLSGIDLGLPGVPAFDAQDNLVISDWLAGPSTSSHRHTPARRRRSL